MKLIKIGIGEYLGESIIEGHKVSVNVSSYNEGGFNYSWRVNGIFMHGDGWIGLRLKDIKQGLESDIDYVLEEYNKRN